VTWRYVFRGYFERHAHGLQYGASADTRCRQRCCAALPQARHTQVLIAVQAGPSGRSATATAGAGEAADAAPRRPIGVPRAEHESVLRQLATLEAKLAGHKETAVLREQVCGRAHFAFRLTL
jgi:hypothetical protein